VDESTGVVGLIEETESQKACQEDICLSMVESQLSSPVQSRNSLSQLKLIVEPSKIMQSATEPSEETYSTIRLKYA
jgi:hypothetical protein